MLINSAQITQDLDITGIAAIPNQVHHEVRATRHQISIALIGDDGVGKTDFINRCLKRKIFASPEDGADNDPEIRIRRANVVEAGFEAQLNLVDVPLTGTHWSRETAYKAIIQYAQDMIQEYGEAASQVRRQNPIPDSRIAAALFFVNGLTATKLSTLELGTLAELSHLTKVIVIIAKADCLLPQELSLLKTTIAKQLEDTDIDLFSPMIYAVSTCKIKGMPRVHLKEPQFETIFFKYHSAI